MKKRIILSAGLLGAALCHYPAHAQRFMGVATSNYSTMNSLFLNPASIAASHEKIVVNLFSMNLGVDNSYGTFSKIGSVTNTFNADQSSSAFSNTDGKTFNMMIPMLEVRGPGVLVSLNNPRKMAFAFTTRVRAMNQLNHFDRSLYNTITNPKETPAGNYSFTAKDFNWTGHVWNEYGLSFGSIILDKNEHLLTGGATLRYLGGIAYVGIKGRNLDVTYVPNADSFHATNSDLQFASNIMNAADAVDEGVNASGIFNNFFGGSSSGIGGDIGFTYTYRPGHTGNNATTGNESYLFKVSAAVTDLGSINYKQGNNSYINVAGNGYVAADSLFINLQSYPEFRRYMVKQGYRADTGSADTKLKMPTTLVIGADYHIKNNFYANLTCITNMVDRQVFGNSYYTQVVLTPRYDSRIFTVGLPITYSGLAGDLKVGLGLRASGFFLGSDDMLALISDRQHGMSFYFGGYVPIYKKFKNANREKSSSDR